MLVSLYASILTLWYLVLSWRVISYRQKNLVAFGENNDPVLQARVRGHANFSEYVPLALILLYFFDGTGVPTWMSHVCGVALVLGRLAHGYSSSFLAGKPPFLYYRVAGMLLTLLPMAAMAGYLLIDYFL